MYEDILGNKVSVNDWVLFSGINCLCLGKVEEINFRLDILSEEERARKEREKKDFVYPDRKRAIFKVRKFVKVTRGKWKELDEVKEFSGYELKAVTGEIDA